MDTGAYKQLVFNIRPWGGRRKRAGQKKHSHDINHVARPRITGREPVGLTLKLRDRLPTLRTESLVRRVAAAFAKAKILGLRIIHFSVQSNHLHIVAEVESNEILTLGMRSLTVSCAKAIQKILGIKGRILRGRYHMHVLSTPTEVKNAIKYILFNLAKHAGTRKSVDPYSSIYEAKDLITLIGIEEFDRLRPELWNPPRWHHVMREALAEPTSWLLKTGWRRGR